MPAAMFPVVLGLLGAIQAATDTSFAVRPDARLELRDVGGRVVVQAWDQPRVRLRTGREQRRGLRIEQHGAVVVVLAPIGQDDGEYRLTVPRAMALTITGHEVDADITGVHGDMRVESIEGDITVRDGGALALSTVDGDIIVRGAAGAVRLATTDGEIYVSDVRGAVEANTLDGDILLQGVVSGRVMATTVDGEIRYDGTIEDGGRYRFTTHDGDVILAVPRTINATVSVATFEGDFASTFPVRVVARSPHGYRFSFTLGNGSAQVELESFDGAIRVRSR